MTEAEERFAERLAVERGAGPRPRDHRSPGSRSTATGRSCVAVVCVAHGRERTIEVEADDLLEAYRRIVTSAAELRLSAAWLEVVEHP